MFFVFFSISSLLFIASRISPLHVHCILFLNIVSLRHARYHVIALITRVRFVVARASGRDGLRKIKRSALPRRAVALVGGNGRAATNGRTKMYDTSSRVIYFLCRYVKREASGGSDRAIPNGSGSRDESRAEREQTAFYSASTGN